MDFTELGIDTRNWVDSAQDGDCWRALVNDALKLRIPYAMELVKSLRDRYYYIRYKKC